MRVARPRRAGRQPDDVEQLAHARPPRGPSPPSPCARSGSLRIDSTFCRGSRLDIGSWKTICMRRRAVRSASPFSEATSTPSKLDLARGRLDQPQDRPAERGLAAAGLPHQAVRRPAHDVEVDAVDGLDLRRPSGRRGCRSRIGKWTFRPRTSQQDVIGAGSPRARSTGCSARA